MSVRWRHSRSRIIDNSDEFELESTSPSQTLHDISRSSSCSTLASSTVLLSTVLGTSCVNVFLTVLTELRCDLRSCSTVLGCQDSTVLGTSCVNVFFNGFNGITLGPPLMQYSAGVSRFYSSGHIVCQRLFNGFNGITL